MRWRTLGAGMLLALVQAGCGGTAEVKGRVTLDGKPVAGATILFVPEPGSSARPATGFTDAEGNFRLTTFRPNDGAVVGAYKIVVTKSEGVSSPPDPNRASKKRRLSICGGSRDGGRKDGSSRRFTALRKRQRSAAPCPYPAR